ncbi:MAG: serine hydrolase domain-containing protein [Nocardioidaceae bacterium]
MEVQGSVQASYEPVRDAFSQIVTEQPGTGAAVAIWHAGDYVVDLWGGWADAARTRPWQRDSIAQPYSVAKPFAAICVLLLVERGLLSLDDSARVHWPELTADATVRDLLSHQAGLVALDDPAPTEVFYDWDGLCALLARQTPSWPPGTAHGESALFYGHPLGELVRRIDGRSLGRFLHEEVCGPLGLDFAIGLPPSEHGRVVELTGFEEAFGPTMSAGRPALFDRALRNPPGALEAAVVNGPDWRRAEIPAVNGHGTARAVAGFYAALSGGAILPTTLLTAATSVVASGTDQVLGDESAWGLGFAVDEDGYGMGGIGGHLGWWSREGEYALGYVTGSLGNYGAVDAVETAFRECLGLPPL